MRLSNSEADCVGEALAEGAGGDFDTVGVTRLGVTGSEGIELTEALEVIEAQLEAEEVEDDVLQSAAVWTR